MFQQVLGQWVLYPDYFSLLSSLYCTFAQIKTGTNKLLKKNIYKIQNCSFQCVNSLKNPPVSLPFGFRLLKIDYMIGNATVVWWFNEICIYINNYTDSC